MIELGLLIAVAMVVYLVVMGMEEEKKNAPTITKQARKKRLNKKVRKVL